MPTNKPFTAEELQEIDSIPMNFVVGKERSGTTLLQVMLNAHPNIIAPPESRFIIMMYFRYGKTKKWTEKILTDLCSHLFKEAIFRDLWGIDKEKLLSTLLASREMLNYPLICKIIYCMSSPLKKEVHLFFDKNPLYYYFLPELAVIFPEAKYIHLVRDYRANYLSHRKVFPVKKATDIVYRWMKVNMLIEKAKKHSPEKYFTLTYESLVVAPVENIQKLCLFFNFSFDERMVSDHQSGMYSKFQSNNTELFRKVNESVFRPITSTNIDEWKKMISPGELVKVEAIAGKYAETIYGYLREDNRNNVKIGYAGILIMELRYKIIKAIFKKALSSFWFNRIFRKCVKIKRNIWKTFKLG